MEIFNSTIYRDRM